LKTAVLIPAFNAALSISEVLFDIERNVSRDDILVIDDGSTDATAGVVRELGFECFQFVRNQGKGACLKFGYRLLQIRGYEAAISIDADNQHDADFISSLQEKANSDDFSLIIGNRMEDLSPMPLDRIFSNKLSSFLISCVTGGALPDSQCGFRWVLLDHVNQLHLDRNGFDFESQQIIETHKRGFATGSVPISTRYKDEASSINRLSDTFAFCSLLARTALTKSKEYLLKND
jgi:glycosyltransferase involved in cell wall biosynthesis